MHVLVVDDQTIDRYVIKKTLSPLFKVTTLSSTREAVSFAHSNSFDIALLNVMIHNDLDGLCLLLQLKKISITPFLPIAITSHIDEIRYQKLINAGFSEVMQKPFDMSEFIRLSRVPQHIGSLSA